MLNWLRITGTSDDDIGQGHRKMDSGDVGDTYSATEEDNPPPPKKHTGGYRFEPGEPYRTKEGIVLPKAKEWYE